MKRFQLLPSVRLHGAGRRAVQLSVVVFALILTVGTVLSQSVVAGLISTSDLFAVSAGPSDSAADAAYNTSDGTWLVVWKAEDVGATDVVGVIMGNIVAADQTTSGPFPISPPSENMSDPRVAYDPVGGEWIVVWAGGIHPLTTKPEVRARLVTAAGTLVGSGPRRISDGEGVAHPDVTAGFGERSSAFMVAWEETIAGRQHVQVQVLVADDEQPTGTAVVGPAIDLMTGEDSRDADGRRPRLAESTLMTDDGPVNVVTFRRDFVTHSDVVVAGITGETPKLLHVGSADVNAVASIAFNPISEQVMVTFDTDQEGERAVLGQKYVWSKSESELAPIGGPPFRLADGAFPDLHASPNDDTFLMTFENTTLNLAHIVGARVASAERFLIDRDQMRLATGSHGDSLVLWRQENERGKLFEALALENLEPLENHPPIIGIAAPAVVESGQAFLVSGLDSRDPDFDTLLFHWSVKGNIRSSPLEPQPGEIILRAPTVEGDDIEEIFVELTVTDARVDPSDAPTASALIKVVPPGLGSARFARGDANASGDVDVSDTISILNGLFVAGERITCADAADANDDGDVDLSDPIFLLNYLFVAGEEPPAPGAETCDVDPTQDSLPECDVTFCGVN